MKQISTTSPFLQNALFINDKYKFSLVGHNLGLEETRIYSDEEKFLRLKNVSNTFVITCSLLLYVKSPCIHN